MEHEEAVWGRFTDGWASIIPSHAVRQFLLPRLFARTNVALALAQFGYLLVIILLVLDRRRSNFRMVFLFKPLCLLWLIFFGVVAHGSTPVDVLHYSVTLEPDIAAKSVKGTVRIRFSTESDEAELNCGDLTIDSVRLAGAALKFSVMDHRLAVSLPANAQAREIEIDFHGTPRYGIRFFPDRQQVYTIFSTSQWMVCVDDPADKATLTFKLILPANLTPVANGQLVSQRELPNNKRVSEWRQNTAIPTYIFGFAAGPFHVVKEKRRNVELQYLATNYTPR